MQNLLLEGGIDVISTAVCEYTRIQIGVEYFCLLEYSEVNK